MKFFKSTKPFNLLKILMTLNFFKFSFSSRRFLTPAKMLFLWTGRRPSFPAWSTWWISTRWTRDPCQPSCRTLSWTPGWWRRQVEIRGQPVLPVSVPIRHIAAGNWSVPARPDMRILQQRTLSVLDTESSSLAWTTWTSTQWYHAGNPSETLCGLFLTSCYIQLRNWIYTGTRPRGSDWYDWSFIY